MTDLANRLSVFQFVDPTGAPDAPLLRPVRLVRPHDDPDRGLVLCETVEGARVTCRVPSGILALLEACPSTQKERRKAKTALRVALRDLDIQIQPGWPDEKESNDGE